MAKKIFSKKEAISHGIRMAKKYFGVIFVVVLIYVAFETISGLMSHWAGSSVSRSDISVIYKESSRADQFYDYLVENGYINKYGMVQDKLQNMTDASALVLSAEWEGDRDRIFRLLDSHRYRLFFPRAVYYLLSLVFLVIGILLQIGWLKISLMLSRDQRPAVRDIFSNGSLFFKFLLGGICYALALMGGFILLIVPGIILMVMLGMYAYLIVDKGMGPIASLRASRALTKGVRGPLFVFGSLLFLFNLAGFLCLLVGLIFTIPASGVAAAYVYDQLQKQEGIEGE